MKPEERRHQSFFKSKLVLASLVFIFFIIGFYTTSSLYQNYQIRKEIAILDKVVKDLDSDNKELKLAKNKLTNPDFIEREAKLKLNFKKEGEEVVILIDNPYSSEVKEEDKNKKNEGKEDIFESGNVKKWINIIFGSN
jgi:cell division protein FtsL